MQTANVPTPPRHLPCAVTWEACESRPTRLDPYTALASFLSPVPADALVTQTLEALGRVPHLQPVPPPPRLPSAKQVYGMPEGAPVVVFDLDGTLTPSNRELFRQLVQPAYVARARPGAVELTWAWATRGYGCVYLTGRPRWLAPMTRAWFARRGFAPGVIQFTQRYRDMLPSHAFTGTFKHAALRDLQAKGFAVRCGYGNVGTDVRAYHRFGLPPERIVTTGARPGRENTVPAHGGFRHHLSFVSSQPWAYGGTGGDANTAQRA